MKCFIAIVLVACFAIAAADQCFEKDKWEAKIKEMKEKKKAAHEECKEKEGEDKKTCYKEKFGDMSFDKCKSDNLAMALVDKKKTVEDGYNSCSSEKGWQAMKCVVDALKDKCDEYAEMAKKFENMKNKKKA